MSQHVVTAGLVDSGGALTVVFTLIYLYVRQVRQTNRSVVILNSHCRGGVACGLVHHVSLSYSMSCFRLVHFLLNVFYPVAIRALVTDALVVVSFPLLHNLLKLLLLELTLHPSLFDVGMVHDFSVV